MGVESIVRLNGDPSASNAAVNAGLAFAGMEVCGSADRTESLIRELRALNRLYLELLVRQGGLPDNAMRELRTLPDPSLDAAARCPFTLFAFDIESSAAAGAQRCNAVRGESLRAECAAVACFLAWHGARVDPVGARVLLGLDARQLQVLRAASLASLQPIVDILATTLRPRWADNDRFWSRLFQCARAGGAGELSAVFSYGRQLLASDALARNSPSTRNTASAGIPASVRSSVSVLRPARREVRVASALPRSRASAAPLSPLS